MAFDFFYWLGLGTTIFALALLLVGGLGDYLKNIFNLQQKHILVMAIGCFLSVVPYVRTAKTQSVSCLMQGSLGIICIYMSSSRAENGKGNPASYRRAVDIHASSSTKIIEKSPCKCILF